MPELIPYEGYDCWATYEEILYKIFRNHFIDNYTYFKNRKVKIRFHPIMNGKEEAFYHVTCNDYLKTGDRQPDLRRCERIKWVKAYIENYNCNSLLCESCDGIRIWEEPYKSNSRIHILSEKERYIVVIEKRESYYLLITAHYLEQDHTIRKKLKRYNKAKNALN